MRAEGEGSRRDRRRPPGEGALRAERPGPHSGDGAIFHARIAGLELEEVIEKMSKSRGNVVNPDEVIAEYGADSMRLYEMFIGPLDKEAPWTTEGILGVYRFLQRAWRLLVDEDAPGEPARALPGGQRHDGAGAPRSRRPSQGVTDDLEAMRFNTAISKLMVFVRDVAREAPLAREAASAFVLLLAPFAPHLAEELWQKLGHAESIAYAPWPVADPGAAGRGRPSRSRCR